MQDNPETTPAHVLAIEDDAMLLRAFSDYIWKVCKMKARRRT